MWRSIPAKQARAILIGRSTGFNLVAVFLSFVFASNAFSQRPVAPVTKPGTTPEVNDRIARLALAIPAKSGEYLIASGDILTIQVFDVPELSRDVRVNETGFISLPLLPVKVHATGLTAPQLEEKLSELLRTNGLVSTPQVSVSLKEQKGQAITVIGAVRNSTVIQSAGQTTLLEVLSRAGGVSEDAGSVVIVTRTPSTATESADDPADIKFAPESQIFTIGLGDLLETGNSRFNIPIIGGDVVSVPRAGIVYVVGAVNHPGGFVMQNDRDHLSTLKVMSLAGGTTRSAKVKHAMVLRRNPDTGKRDELPVDLDKVMNLKAEDMTLQASDILFVPDSSSRKALNRASDIAISLTTGIALVGAGRL